MLGTPKLLCLSLMFRKLIKKEKKKLHYLKNNLSFLLNSHNLINIRNKEKSHLVIFHENRYRSYFKEKLENKSIFFYVRELEIYIYTLIDILTCHTLTWKIY